MDLDKYIEDNFDNLIQEQINLKTKKVVFNDNLNVYNDLNDKTNEKYNNDFDDEDNEDIEDDKDKTLEYLKNINNLPDDDITKLYGHLFNQDNNIYDENVEFDYYFNLLNIFTVYYNEKYNKKDNYFTSSEDDKPSEMIELFLETIFEYKCLMKHKNITDNEILINTFYLENDNEIKKIFNDNEIKLYVLEFDDKKIYTEALLICLNYVVKNNINNFKIFNLKSF
jgi:hypothetical protein